MMIYILVNLELQPEVNMRITKKAEEKKTLTVFIYPISALLHPVYG